MRAVTNAQAVEMFCPFRPGKCFGRDCMCWEQATPDHYKDPKTGNRFDAATLDLTHPAAADFVKIEGKGFCGMAGRR